jgi:hypothetical protein
MSAKDEQIGGDHYKKYAIQPDGVQYNYVRSGKCLVDFAELIGEKWRKRRPTGAIQFGCACSLPFSVARGVSNVGFSPCRQIPRGFQ